MNFFHFCKCLVSHHRGGLREEINKYETKTIDFLLFILPKILIYDNLLPTFVLRNNVVFFF